MPFGELKYSEKKAEREALHSLLDEYFKSRAGAQAHLSPEGETGKSAPSVIHAKSRPPEKKPKPPIPTRSLVVPTPSPGPPPINRSTRPSQVNESVPKLEPPPPLETPALWKGRVPRFEYPPPDHSASGIELFNRYLPYPINELHSATISLFKILYPDPAYKPKNVQSPVKLIMRDMESPAAHAANSMSYTPPFTGQSFSNVTHRSDLVFSTRYLTSLENHSDPAFEIRGIILHELTHTFQYSAENTPGGLTEGIADFVRLNSGHAAMHWTESPEGKKWDQGYETTAYFLDWANKNIYEGLVVQVNEWLGKNKTYDERQMFDTVMPGWSWDILWDQYLSSR